MTCAIDPVELAARLIACPSVTPRSAGAFDVLEAALAPIGFEVHRFVVGEAPDGPVEKMVAISTLSRPAKAGRAIRSALNSRAACSTAAAPST